MMRIGFTDHAIDRYIQFFLEPIREQQRRAREMGDTTAEIPPVPTRAEVRALLDEQATSAVKLKEKTCRGDTQWRVEALGCVLVTKPDRKEQQSGEHVCVTVLPPHVFEPDQMDEFEMELRQAEADKVHLREEALRRVQDEVKVEAKRVEAAPKASFPKTQPKEVVLSDRRRQIEDYGKQILLLEWEKKILGDLLKTIRTKLSSDRNMFEAKEALRIAVACLHTLADDPAAKEALRRIEGIQPGLVTPEFYKLQVERKSA